MTYLDKITPIQLEDALQTMALLEQVAQLIAKNAKGVDHLFAGIQLHRDLLEAVVMVAYQELHPDALNDIQPDDNAISSDDGSTDTGC